MWDHAGSCGMMQDGVGWSGMMWDDGNKVQATRAHAFGRHAYFLCSA